MSGVHHITGPARAREVAAGLNRVGRTRPAVVVSVPRGRDEPYIDVERIADEVGELADVYLLSGACSWEFTAAMPPRTQVYGGAGRVYPVDLGWTLDPFRSALRLAYSPADGPRATAELIQDALVAAYRPPGLTVERRARGTTDRRAGTTLDRRAGTTIAAVPETPDDGSVARPSPRLLADGLTGAAPPPSSPVRRRGPDAATLTAIVREREAELRDLRLQVRRLYTDLAEANTDVARLESELDRCRRRLERAESDVRRLRVDQRRGPGGRDIAGDDAPPLHPEDRFRLDVYRSWLRRIPAAEREARPLTEYRLGPRFLDSLEEVQGIAPAKVVDVVVEVLTGIADTSAGRELHQLRTGAGGADPATTRDDGATCWRVALQRNTPSARRLHFWRTAGHIELSRVVLHDDVTP